MRKYLKYTKCAKLLQIVSWAHIPDKNKVVNVRVLILKRRTLVSNFFFKKKRLIFLPIL